jgi:diguanylate cyclase (GGDEF)-like protein
MADFVLQFTALALLALRGVAPDFLSMTGSNALVIGGTILLYIGLEQFTGKRSSQYHNYILLAVFIVIHSFFAIIYPNITVRNILFALGLLVVCSQCAWLTLYRVPAEMRRITRGTGYVFVLFCLISLIRLTVDLFIQPNSNIFRSNLYDTLAILSYQMLFILLTFSLSLVVNRQLLTEHNLAEKIIQLRLRLWEYGSTHAVDEMMQEALDEIEDLTGSKIGFYHFAEEDQNTLSLQAWSTRTMAEFCKAEGKGMHYPISEAGVWVDCVHQRKPVIHNDYAALPNRKGMPEGHAEVIREVVVPTLRDGRVVSILGVGNKPVGYDEHDVELIAYIADLVWTIVEQKRSDEQIRLLNTQLEQMAMTDELTGLTNRRSFYLEGEKEIKKAHRYHTPFSLLMVDLDEFKTINDRFGHEAGDKMLQCVARALLDNIREIDVLARLGGEEFGILLPNTKVTDAVHLAERLRLAIEGVYCSVGERKMNVTASIGVTSARGDVSTLDAMLRNADIAMYRAKSRGRNLVVSQDESLEA